MGRQRFTDDQIRDIRTSSQTRKWLGSYYDVSPVSIHNILHFESYRHVEGAAPNHAQMTIELATEDKEHFFNIACGRGIPLAQIIAETLHGVAVDDRREHIGIVKGGAND